jgi:hypothetical protein
MDRLKNLRVKIFADEANIGGILKVHANPLTKGFTTSATLMRQTGISDDQGLVCHLLAEWGPNRSDARDQSRSGIGFPPLTSSSRRCGAHAQKTEFV